MYRGSVGLLMELTDGHLFLFVLSQTVSATFSLHTSHTHPGHGHKRKKETSNMSDVTKCSLGPTQPYPFSHLFGWPEFRLLSSLGSFHVVHSPLSVLLLFPRSCPINTSGHLPFYKHCHMFTRGQIRRDVVLSVVMVWVDCIHWRS